MTITLLMVLFLTFVHCRSRWLKEPDADSTELFRMVAEIFILWCKSHASVTSTAQSVTAMNTRPG